MTLWVAGRPLKPKDFKSKPFVVQIKNPCAVQGCRSADTIKKEMMNERGESVLIPLCPQHENL